MRKLLITLSATATMVLASCSNQAKEIVVEEVETIEVQEPAVQTIKLEEVVGEFTTKELTLKAGTYSFEVTNNGIDHEVAFVLAPKKENLEQSDWIADAMLTAAVADGQTASSKQAVTLEKGEYVYFCPMNPTPQYTLTVE